MSSEAPRVEKFEGTDVPISPFIGTRYPLLSNAQLLSLQLHFLHQIQRKTNEPWNWNLFHCSSSFSYLGVLPNFTCTISKAKTNSW
jgi:hypothetical protein